MSLACFQPPHGKVFGETVSFQTKRLQFLKYVSLTHSREATQSFALEKTVLCEIGESHQLARGHHRMCCAITSLRRQGNLNVT